MRLRCSSKKDSFNNLTVNTEYEAIEEGDIYIVTNDAGLRSRYAKRYFAVVPQAPPVRTIDDAVTVTVRRTNESIDINVSIDARDLFTYSLNTARTLNSCGVRDVQGIRGIKENIISIMADGRRWNGSLVNGTPADFFKKVMDAVIALLKTDNNFQAAFYTFSDVVEEDHGTSFDTVLTELSALHIIGDNPNSGNTINFWLVTRAE